MYLPYIYMYICTHVNLVIIIGNTGEYLVEYVYIFISIYTLKYLSWAVQIVMSK